MNEPEVDVVIVNWNSGGYLADCIRSLDALDPRGYRIAGVSIIDNASTDGSADIGATRVPAHVVRNATNLGFGAACNIGARIGRAELILFLNPDARLDASSLGATVPRLRDDASLWVAGAQLIDENGRVQRTCSRAPSGPRMFAHALGIDRLLRATGYVMAEWPHDETRFVDHVIGAFYLIRREAFERLGGFDERFFVYLEDLDLSLRVRDAGGKCLYVTEAVAHHAGGGTTRSIKATRLFYSVRSRLQFAAKHFNVPWIVAVWTASLTIEPLLRVAAALAHRSVKELGEVRSAYGQLLRWIVR
jgi:GT2 family glycosyltransferase